MLWNERSPMRFGGVQSTSWKTTVGQTERETIMKIMKASEDYLEAMLMLKEELGYIRSVDIAVKLGVTKPSVSYATKRLRENGYITMDDSGLITLNESGMEIAKKIYERHTVLTNFIKSLGVDEQTAYDDACLMEHDISDVTFEAIKKHIAELEAAD